LYGPPITSITAAVGQDEDPLSLVWSADFRRAENSPRRFVTKAFQFANDFSESKADMSFDVFKEADLGSHSSNSICDPRPEVPWVFFPESLPCGAEWLTRIAAAEDRNAVTKLAPREGFKIRPKRCCVQESRFHF
jgi:hypothetical protein